MCLSIVGNLFCSSFFYVFGFLIFLMFVGKNLDGPFVLVQFNIIRGKFGETLREVVQCLESNTIV
jgi:hypothetical protein